MQTRRTRAAAQHALALTGFICLIASICVTDGLIHDLRIDADQRPRFFIENFGFEAGGKLEMTIMNFKLEPGSADKAKEYRVGFLIKQTVTDSTRFLEETEESGGPCLLENPDILGPSDIIVKIENWELTTFVEEIELGEEGLYNIYFVNCEPDTTYSFELKLVQYNVGPNYLSAGLMVEPFMFTMFFGIYVLTTALWVFGYLREGKKYHIHYLMTVLIFLKALSVLFKAIEMHYLAEVGIPGGWATIYYFFTFLKGIMLFIVVAAIGTGWAFIKPFLSDTDKKIFLVVIPLQILDNIALVIIEESAPGSQSWFTWKDIFRLVDIICCGAILIPIIRSIKHLKEASQIDGKAARNMNKLTLFRQYYILVVSYIYFTRIIVYLLDATLPFRQEYLGDFFTETATLVFLCITGYKFRPVEDNPYFKIDEDAVEEDTKVPKHIPLKNFDATENP